MQYRLEATRPGRSCSCPAKLQVQLVACPRFEPAVNNQLPPQLPMGRGPAAIAPRNRHGSTRFGTEGSEVQNLSPRPTQISKNREKALETGPFACTADVVGRRREVLPEGGCRAVSSRRFCATVSGSTLLRRLRRSSSRTGRMRIGFSALAGRVPIVIAPAGSGVEALASSFGDGGRRRSAFGVIQEFLNASTDATWGLVSDGLRGNVSASRRLRDGAPRFCPRLIRGHTVPTPAKA